MSTGVFTLQVSHLRRIARARKANDNMRSIVVSLERFGVMYGLVKPHRIAHYIAQLAQESGGFRYDREIWGPTAAQKRYDVRADLGNTPERDGDGEKYKGRTAGMLTGKANYTHFHVYCRQMGFNPPDFVAQPDLVNTDPWEGLVPLWYWDHHNLNKYADSNDLEMITRLINGGDNGISDRRMYYTRTALVFLGYPVTAASFDDSVRAFQAVSQDNHTYAGSVDGVDGPKTRAALHRALVKMGGLTTRADSPVRSAPVVEDKPVAVAPKAAERPHADILTMAISGISTALAAFANLDWRVQLFFGAMAVLGIGLMISGRLNLAKTIRDTRKALEA